MGIHHNRSSPLQLMSKLTTSVLETINISTGQTSKDGDGSGNVSAQQLENVVRGAVEKMCVGTASTLLADAQPHLPEHTARRQTRKYVKMKKKRAQEVDGPVRTALKSFFSEAASLVTTVRDRLRQDSESAAGSDVHATLLRIESALRSVQASPSS